MAKIKISLFESDTKKYKYISFNIPPPLTISIGILAVAALYLTKPTVQDHVNAVFKNLNSKQVASLKDNNISLHFTNSILVTKTTIKGNLLSVGVMKYVYVVPSQLEYIKELS